MAYGKIKADAFIYDNSGTDEEVTMATIVSNSTKADTDSPDFTGTPTAPTAAAGTNTTQIATTAFVETSITDKADLASPAFTGVPTTPTAATGTNTAQIATTAFVAAEISNHFHTDTWTAVSTNTGLAPNGNYLVDTSGSVLTVDLPNNPSAGSTVRIADAKGSFATNNLTINRNTKNIVGAAADLVANVANAVVTLIYSGDATVGWLVK